MSSPSRFAGLSRLVSRCVALGFLFAVWCGHAVDDPRTLWRLLDYIAVDYTEAVRDGEVINAAEYAEMQEFAGTVRDGLQASGEGEAEALAVQAVALVAAIGERAGPEEVATQARALAAALAERHGLASAPAAPPDLPRGRQLYAAQCASCHGPDGRGDGPLAAGLDPPPIAFADRERAAQRSLFALYEVISQGIEGTAMPSYAALPEADRWALAFVAGQFAFDASEDAAGQARWRNDAGLRQHLGGLEAQVRLRPAELVGQIGAADAARIVGWLRRHPAEGLPDSSQSLARVREGLRAAQQAFVRGDRAAAGSLAVAAYLDGFEPLEPALAVRAPDLMRTLEAAMTSLRTRLAATDVGPEEIAAAVTVIEADLARAEAALGASEGSWLATYLGALTLLVREGLEALLVVVAMLAFLRKAQRPEGQPYVYAGAGLALGAGVLTWLAARHLIQISGASREITEGIAALSAAVILVFVGLWMHGKSQADAWQRYVRERLGGLMSRRSMGLLFGLAFIVVYREVFETILFFIALIGQGPADAALAGVATAVLVLAVIAWQMLRLSRRLPLGLFFSVSAVLIALLAVILTGKGVAALQEAGWVAAGLVRFPRVDLLGLYPTWQGLSAQALCLLVLLAGFAWNRRPGGGRR